MNITLIGMPAAGKTHIGKRLAPRLSLEFVDIDDLLERVYKRSIQALLDELGEQGYMQAEKEMLLNGTSGRQNILVAPGGSVVYVKDAMEHSRAISTIIYLQVPFEIIEARLKARPPRAVIGLGSKSLRELYDERAALCEAYADFTIRPEEMTMDEIATHVGSLRTSR